MSAENSVDIRYRTILSIAWPIMVSGLMNAILVVTDTAFLGHVGENELGAAGNGGLLYFVLLTIGMGFSTGAQIIMGRRNGEKDYKAIGHTLTQTFYVLIGIAAVLFMFMQLGAPSFLEATVHSENISGLIREFLHYRSFGIFFSLLNLAYLAFYVGITKTRVLLWNSLLLVSTNIFLDYCLIFGNYGFPQMGVKGAALATVVAEIGTFLFMTIYTLASKRRPVYGLFRFERPSKGRIKRIFKTAGPMMLQNFIALGGWYIFFSIIEHLGERELSVSHIIRSLYMLLMIPVFSLANTTNTMVSNLIGQRNEQLVFPLLRRSTALALLSNLIFLVITLSFRERIIGIFTNNESLVEDTYATLYVILAAMFIFSVATVQFNAVSGTGNTKHSLVIESICIAIYLILAFILVEQYKVDVAVAWATEFVYFGLLGSLCYFYLKKGMWKYKEI